MVLLIDNYDSFSYNLYQLVGCIEPSIRVIRNDEKSAEEIDSAEFSHIIISPGPGRPENAGICFDIIKRFAGKIPILGVCLGHQAICGVFGATVGYAKELMHGKASDITVDNENCPIFFGLTRVISAARYHSLAAYGETVPESLVVTARTDDGEIMAVKHKDFEVYGVQFHPESILTPQGKTIITNFLNREEKR
ncbi:MAG: aminodeoxychorismate/anthranilate synthase component II [Clostridiales bacterium]|jgi:anthranilate synthase component 2|nr:aminodeoxychorismate/anthranilate synthase component II [Clostridiales bacterium]